MENIIELKNSKIVTDIINQALMTVAIQFKFTKENAPRFPAFIDFNVIENSMNNGLKMFGYELKPLLQRRGEALLRGHRVLKSVCRDTFG